MKRWIKIWWFRTFRAGPAMKEIHEELERLKEYVKNSWGEEE